MRKYNNPRLLNTVVSGTGMLHPVKPHVIVSDTVSEFVKGDLMDANAISELVDQKIGSAEGATEADVTELRQALAEEAAARTSADQTLDERITGISTSIPQAISDGIAQVVAGADADYDTLKEISDYIKSDKTGAAQLSTAINNNTTAIDNESTRAQAKEAELEAAIDTKAAQSTTYTKAEVDTLVNSVDVSEQLANYYTKSEIDNAGYLTEHQDISNKADKSELFSGDYNDLTNKPTIPTVPTNVSEFTNDAGYITQHQDISGKANTSDLAAVATSGSYNDLDDKPMIPTVPTNVSSFTNDANYQTQQQVDDRFTALINAAPAALDTLGEIATKLADNDDAVSAIVTSISDEIAAREAADTAITTNITELASTVSANDTAINNKVDALETSLEDRISDVEDAMPTKVSDLANDNGDILSDPKWQTIYDGNGTCRQTGPYHYGYGTTEFTLSEGDVYKVTINNNEYIKTAYLNSQTNMPTISDGNFAWPYTAGDSMFTDNWLIYKSTSGYGVICIYSEDSSLSGQTVTVKIEKQITNKIDAKYIPDIYAQKTDLQEQLQSDWSETDSSSKAYIQNKPVIPTIPTNVSAFQNDAGYITQHQSLGNYYTKAEVDSSQQAQNTEISSKADKSTTYTKTEVDNLIAPKANVSDVYSKTEADSTFIKEHQSLAEYAKKTELVDSYSKTETNGLLANKANSADLATVATTGSYNDLTNKPTIPDAQIQSDWNQTDTSAKDYIKNKPTKVSELQNDAEYLSLAPDANGHTYVDLGLPSGTLWATMNVGASSETDYGNYYQYGKGAAQYAATSGDSNYSGTEDPLAASADTATQVWGGSWHMPTRAQLQELTANTTYEWTTINGVNGGKFTATNGNYVFFPAAGDWEDGSQSSVGDYGYYWGSSPNGSYYAYGLGFCDGGNDVYDYNREYGYSVRGVLDSKQLQPVSFSGDYNDLANKPTIPTVWTGTQAEYDAITSPSASTIYFIKG